MAESRVAFGAEFIGAAGYLDSATYGLPSTDTLRALSAAQDAWARGTLFAPGLDAEVAAAREGFAELVGVSADTVAMGATVASLIGLIAAAIDDESSVAVVPGEFTSVTFPFAAQEKRGVRIVEVAAADLATRAAEFDVVAVSVTQSSNGATVDLTALRRATAGTDTLVILDATQALGWIDTGQVELSWADAVLAPSYKWLLAPRGVAWMYLSGRLAEQLTPHGANWYAGQEPWQTVYGLPLRLADNARRFDSSPAWFTLVGAATSLRWLAKLDRAEVDQHTRSLANRFREHLGMEPGFSPIVSVTVPDAASRLTSVGVKAAQRAGGVRLSFHLYNTTDDVDRAVAALRGD